MSLMLHELGRAQRNKCCRNARKGRNLYYFLKYLVYPIYYHFFRRTVVLGAEPASTTELEAHITFHATLNDLSTSAAQSIVKGPGTCGVIFSDGHDI